MVSLELCASIGMEIIAAIWVTGKTASIMVTEELDTQMVKLRKVSSRMVYTKHQLTMKLALQLITILIHVLKKLTMKSISLLMMVKMTRYTISHFEESLKNNQKILISTFKKDKSL